MAGPTVGIRDLERITLQDRFLIEWLVIIAVFLVLVVLLLRTGGCLLFLDCDGGVELSGHDRHQ